MNTVLTFTINIRENRRSNQQLMFIMLESEYVGDSEFADNECDTDHYLNPPNYQEIFSQYINNDDSEPQGSYRLPQHLLCCPGNQAKAVGQGNHNVPLHHYRPNHPRLTD
jgi:hypothetical protein